MVTYSNSYIICSTSDEEIAIVIRDLLIDEGNNCVIGKTICNTDEQEEHLKEVKSYDIIILIWSQNSLNDPLVNQKFFKALNHLKKFIIVKTDKATDYPHFTPYRVLHFNSSDFEHQIKTEMGFNTSNDELIQKVKQEDCFNKYYKEIKEECGFLKILGTGNKEPISELYLPLYVKKNNSISLPFDADNLLSLPSKKIIVLGNPGTGKSTLLKYLSIKLLNQKSRVPFFIRISDIMKTSSEVYEYLVIILKQRTNKICAEQITKNESFCNSNYIILFDGYDEITINDQEEFRKRLNKFQSQYGNCKVIITSRFNGYDNKDFIGYDEYRIEQLREIDIEKYIWKVCKDTNSKNDIFNIIKSDSRLYELAKTPFLLAMICTLPNPIGKKANQRANLFKQCTDYLLRKVEWDENRQTESEETTELLKTALKTISIRYFKLDRKDYFDKEELIFLVGRLPGNTSTIPPSEILNKICDNSGLLQRTDSQYYFIHRSIWEYFVALAMLDEKQENIYERATITAWEEPIRLYAGLSLEKDVKDILNGIWKNNKGLALRCITELENLPDEYLIELFNSIDKQERIEVIRKLRTEINLLISNPLDVKRLLVDTISTIFRVEKDCEVIYHAIETLKEFDNNEDETCNGLITKKLDLSRAEERRNKLLGDQDNKFEFICIPSGKFIMGVNDTDRKEEEKPEHLVNLDSFCIGKYPITNEIYYIKSEFPFITDKRDVHSKNSKQPVVYITWYEAYIFAQWLGCDLPTEAEWEYACRSAGLDDEILFDCEKIGDYAWFANNSDNKTHEVGLKKPNSFGIFDIIGNVREWCKDWYSASYYQEIVDNNLTNNPQGPKNGGHKVLRGGCFDWNSKNLIPTYRNYNIPSNSYFANGFRLVFREHSVRQKKKL